MRVFFPIFLPAVNGLQFDLDRGNPGVGGTFFTTIQFATLLAGYRPDWDVVLAHTESIAIAKAPSTLRQCAAPSLQDFLDGHAFQPDDIVVWPSFFLSGLQHGTLARCRAKQVAWSRHPFDPAIRQLAAENPWAHVVCVGEYQWHSNRACSLPVHFIQEIYLGPGKGVPPRPNAPPSVPLNAIHVSSLTPEKGFLDVARAWLPLKHAIPGIRLHVVGGASLYGLNETASLIPASEEFARAILQFIPAEDVRSQRVIFYGTLGDEKNELIRQSDFAILNPSGHSEAFPATPLEMMSLGVPVIASDDFGMADSMRFFPELQIRGPSRIADRAQWLVADADRYLAMRQRALAVASSFVEETPALLTKWAALLESIASGRPLANPLRPGRPFHGSKARLVYRRDIKPLLGKAKRTFLRSDAREAADAPRRKPVST